jgi:hypothetical protein
MLHPLLTFAAEAAKDEPSKVPFYIAGCLLAVWAVAVALMGIRRHSEWPASDGAARGVMGISAVLVLAAMATAVLTG